MASVFPSSLLRQRLSFLSTCALLSLATGPLAASGTPFISRGFEDPSVASQLRRPGESSCWHLFPADAHRELAQLIESAPLSEILNESSGSMDNLARAAQEAHQPTVEGDCQQQSGEHWQSASPARLTFIDQIDMNGWGLLYVQSSKYFPHSLQAYSAGYLEGFHTQQRIDQAINNLFAHDFGEGKEPSAELVNFFEQQVKHAAEQALSHPELSFLLTQFLGLYHGYKAAGGSRSSLELYMHNSAGDLEDLTGVFPNKGSASSGGPESRPGPDPNRPLDCSSLIALQADEDNNLKNAFSAHATWRDFGAMEPRAYKSYMFPALAVPGVTFSSTPGFLSSKDDYYITAAKLVVMETTNAVYNLSLYDSLTPRSLLTWQRTYMANAKARGGKAWVSIFANQNSGTYNNQWMVVDLKLLQPHIGHSISNLPENSLWILEQYPGGLQSGDVSHVLANRSFWPSYNIPYFDAVRQSMGYPEDEAHSYNGAPRARLFAEHAQEAASMGLQGIEWIMRLNDPSDKIQNGSTVAAIASRYDLLSDKPKAFGAIDSKICDIKVGSRGDSWAAAGPTFDPLPPFSWETFKGIAPVHDGHPTVPFNFPYIFMPSGWLMDI